MNSKLIEILEEIKGNENFPNKPYVTQLVMKAYRAGECQGMRDGFDNGYQEGYDAGAEDQY